MGKAVIIWGAPSSGKGTQATLLSKRFGFYHLDTGEWLRRILFGSESPKTKTLDSRREEYKSGKLVDTHWFLKNLSGQIKLFAKHGESLVFSGSPRTHFEAFGDKKTEGLFKILEKEYGRKNIFIFYIEIPEKESVFRGARRLICKVCKSPLIASPKKYASCPFCGAKLTQRIDDKPEIIKARLKEYAERTEPMIKEAEKAGYVVHRIKGTDLPYQIHERIADYF